MTLAAEIGLSPSDYENMTPAQVVAYSDGFFLAKKAEIEIAKHNIYNLASLIKTAVWGKHMPRYESVFPEAKKAEMTDAQMYRNVQALNALLGGSSE